MTIHIDNIIYEALYSLKNIINSAYGESICTKVSFKHIRERMKQREIDVVDLFQLNNNLQNNTDDLISLFLINEEKRPYKINLCTDKVIIVLSRCDDVWKINTVLNPLHHNLHDDELINQNFEKTLNY